MTAIEAYELAKKYDDLASHYRNFGRLLGSLDALLIEPPTSVKMEAIQAQIDEKLAAISGIEVTLPVANLKKI